MHIVKPQNTCKNVLWPDENWSFLTSHIGKNKAFKEKYTEPAAMRGRGSVMFLGCFAASATECFDSVQVQWNLKIIQTFWVKMYCPGSGSSVPAPKKHNCKNMQEWLRTKYWTILKWPPMRSEPHLMERLETVQCSMGRRPLNLLRRVAQTTCWHFLKSYWGLQKLLDCSGGPIIFVHCCIDVFFFLLLFPTESQFKSNQQSMSSKWIHNYYFY